jgi:Macrocin-O-methyltransferase (TylF)
MMREWIKNRLARAGYYVLNPRNHYTDDGLYTIHSDHFRQDPLFRAAYQRGIQANHNLDPHFEWRAHVALWAASCALGVPGDFIECGVNSGFHSSAIMQRLNWGVVDRRFYLIDTFAGPVTSQFSKGEVQRGRLKVAEAHMAAGDYETDIARVRRNFSEWPNAVVVQGVVPEILTAIDTSSVAFLHLDMNCAYPERAGLEHFWPCLSPGAFVLLDDYVYFGYENQTEAIDAAARSLGAEVLSLPTGQGLIVKAVC